MTAERRPEFIIPADHGGINRAQFPQSKLDKDRIELIDNSVIPADNGGVIPPPLDDFRGNYKCQ